MRQRLPAWWATPLIGAFGGWLASLANWPLPWMVGSLLAVIAVRCSGWLVSEVPRGRQVGQWIVASAIGLHFTGEVMREVLAHFGVILAGAVGTLLLGLIGDDIALVRLRAEQIVLTDHDGVTTIEPDDMATSGPDPFAGAAVGLPMWLAIIAAEMLIGGVGIGFFIWDAWNASRISDIILALVYIGVVGFVLDRLVALVGQRITRGIPAN